MRSIKRVGIVIQKAYGGDALTIACQVFLFPFLRSFRLLTSFQIRMAKQQASLSHMCTSTFYHVNSKGILSQIRMMKYTPS